MQIPGIGQVVPPPSNARVPGVFHFPDRLLSSCHVSDPSSSRERVRRFEDMNEDVSTGYPRTFIYTSQAPSLPSKGEISRQTTQDRIDSKSTKVMGAYEGWVDRPLARASATTLFRESAPFSYPPGYCIISTYMSAPPGSGVNAFTDDPTHRPRKTSNHISELLREKNSTVTEHGSTGGARTGRTGDMKNHLGLIKKKDTVRGAGGRTRAYPVSLSRLVTIATRFDIWLLVIQRTTER